MKIRPIHRDHRQPVCIMVTNLPKQIKNSKDCYTTLSDCYDLYGGLVEPIYCEEKKKWYHGANPMFKSHARDRLRNKKDVDTQVAFIQLKNNSMHWVLIQEFDNQRIKFRPGSLVDVPYQIRTA